MMPVWFGAMNMPMPIELKKMSAAKPQYEKSTGSLRSRMKVRATRSRPPVAKGRAPCRSANTPLMGPASRNPTVSGIM